MSIFVCGLDLGQSRDYSARVIMSVTGTEYIYPPDGGIYATHFEGPPILRYDVRDIWRYPLGTKYTDVVADVADKMRRLTMPRYLAVDQTGVGAGVMEMFSSGSPVGIIITAGREAQPGPRPQEWHVPKRELIFPLQAALQNGMMRIAKSLAHADLLVKELLSFRGKFTDSGHQSLEAWREGDHDDLVLAAGIAGWVARLALDLQFRHAAAQARPRPGIKRISPI